MKKIFFIPLTIALTACVAKSGDAQRAIDDFKVSAHTLIEPEHNNYWKNNFNAYRTYPVNFYTKYNRPADSYDQQRMVNLREYARDTAVSARVGQRMVDSETFTVTENKNTYNYKPSSEGVIYKANSELHIDADKVISPIGEIFVDGSYFLLFEPEQDGRVFLIDGAGQVLPKLGHIDEKNVILSREIVVISPKGLHLTPAAPGVSNSPNQKHFEIKYEGIKDTNMSFIYINYENGTMQRFTYPEGRKTIDINGVKFNILRATPDQVVYMILN